MIHNSLKNKRNILEENLLNPTRASAFKSNTSKNIAFYQYISRYTRSNIQYIFTPDVKGKREVQLFARYLMVDLSSRLI